MVFFQTSFKETCSATQMVSLQKRCRNKRAQPQKNMFIEKVLYLISKLVKHHFVDVYFPRHNISLSHFLYVSLFFTCVDEDRLS